MEITRVENRHVFSLPRRGWREVVLFLGLIAAAVTPRSSADGEAGNGCDNEKAAHAGCIGTVGGGALLAKVCSRSDDVARMGARVADDALEVGADAARAGGAASKGLDEAMGVAKLDTVYDSHWEEAAEIIGRLTSESDVEKYPGYFKDAGVELYVSNPQKWAELGGDDLLAMAAVRSPAMREAVKKAASKRFDRALGYLAHVEHVGPRTIARVKERYGVDVIETAARSYKLEFRTADYVYRLLDEFIEEEPISERARFTPARAEQDLREQVDGILVREGRSDIAGLFCWRKKDLENHLFPAFWVGPGVILNSEVPTDFDRLTGLIGAQRGIDGEVFAELWVAFHEPLLSSVCTQERRSWEPGIEDPSFEETEEGVIYHFWSARSAEDCQPREIAVGDSAVDDELEVGDL